MELLEKRYGGVYFKQPNATGEYYEESHLVCLSFIILNIGLTDFLALSSAYQVIETASTYSFWSGMFSNQNASIHVDTSFHRVVPDDHRFVYHDPQRKKFFGTYSLIDKKVKFKVSGTEFIRDLVRHTKEERQVLRNQTKALRNQTKTARHANHTSARNTTISTRVAQLGEQANVIIDAELEGIKKKKKNFVIGNRRNESSLVDR